MPKILLAGCPRLPPWLWCNLLLKYASQTKIAKKSHRPKAFFRTFQGSLKLSMLLESSSGVFVWLAAKLFRNRFHAKQSNRGKILTFREFPFLTPMYGKILECSGPKFKPLNGVNEYDCIYIFERNCHADCSETPRNWQCAFQSCSRSGLSSQRSISQRRLSPVRSSTESAWLGVHFPASLRCICCTRTRFSSLTLYRCHSWPSAILASSTPYELR